MKSGPTGVFRLSDYKVLEYLVEHVDLTLDLTKKPVQSKSSLSIVPNPKSETHSAQLELDGKNMTLESISLNGKPLSSEEYEITNNSLIIKKVPEDKPFTLETTTRLGENTDLFGLYETEGTLLVKAETEGLRRVLYCHDRPDNLATYKTTIIAKKEDYPVLLSNGTLEEKDSNDEVHSVTWIDKTPKPSYLFALVAGKLQKSATHFTTRSNRDVPIEFYVPPEAIPKCDFAKDTLKEAMRWDEEVFQLECELSQHMVAGVDKYAAGASEPTGLNLFNTAYLYATPQTKTDRDFLRVLEVVAHEYFHYWSGDRVTIRDWFNLPFKEGLTTFRAAMFREHYFGTDLIRLLEGKNLDESAPRQDTYTNVRSLYTPAAYEKSANIFRMMMIYLGEQTFYKSMSQFLKDNDGGAVTLENVLDSLSKSTGKNMQAFLRWFTESGIPQVTVTDEYDADKKRYTLKFKTKDSKGRPIPIVADLLDQQGKEIQGNTSLMIDKPTMEFHFEPVDSRPTPSLLRSFSAPVHLDFDYSTQQLLQIMQYDTNSYNRKEASKKLITQMIKTSCSDEMILFVPEFFDAFRSLINKDHFDLSYWLIAELLNLPSEEELFAEMQDQNFDKIAKARHMIQQQIAIELKDDLFRLQKKLPSLPVNTNSPFTQFNIMEAGLRYLNQTCHSYLLHVKPEETEDLLVNQFHSSLGKNMTDTVSALNLLLLCNSSKVNALLDKFYGYWKDDAGAVNYWLKLQASAHSDHVTPRVEELMHHPAFDLSNPNKVRAVLVTFIANPYGFHALSGEGYQLVTKAILKLEQINAPLAANLTEKFNAWDKYDEKRQKLMLSNLEFISSNSVSSDVKNMAKRGLDKQKKSQLPLSINKTFFGTSLSEQIPKVMVSDMSLCK